MLFSIIVPVYNVDKYLRECVDSIIQQTFSDFELILIDDGSSDSSAEICDEYARSDKRVVVVHKANEGSTSARKLAASLAKGEYVVPVDSDDWLDSN